MRGDSENLMSNRGDPPFIVGLGQGIVAPLLELVASVILSASFKISENLGGSPWYLFAIVAIVVIVDFVRNILLGLSHSEFALGNLIGNIIGIILFYAAISSISQEAATQSILLLVALVGSYIVGVILYFRSGS